MWIIKKIVFSAVVFLIVFLFSIEVRAEKRIGVLLFSEEIRYIDATKGFMDTLKGAGFGQPQTKIITENAGANKAKAAEVVQKFAAARMDLIFTAGTHATIAVTQEIKDVPIVFSVVYDPVEAGIAKSWKSSGNNTTGTSSKTPMSKLMGSLKQFAPIKRLAVLYTPGERNSEAQLKDIQRIQANYGIKIIPVPLTRVEEITQLLPLVISKADALYITGSNLINSQISKIVDMATEAKMVTITHLEDLVERGVLLGVCPSSYLMGRQAGKKAVQIFKGAKPSSIPIEFLQQFNVMINLKTAEAGSFQVPSDFMTTVKRTIK
ncbi:MAG TPA: ABC transporter substrate-binding protein [Syntrophales bacterium]|nr:ABC transporter substrate-binding protein [Syntrophales bacterium]